MPNICFVYCPSTAQYIPREILIHRPRGNYGQLVILEKTDKKTFSLDNNDDLLSKLNQEEVFVLNLNEKMRLNLWIEKSTNPNEELIIEPFNGGQVFTTTSRSKRRELGVNLLTSHQIACRCSNPHKLLVIFNYWKNGADPSSIVGEVNGVEISPQEVKVAYDFFNGLVK